MQQQEIPSIKVESYHINPGEQRPHNIAMRCTGCGLVTLIDDLRMAGDAMIRHREKFFPDFKAMNEDHILFTVKIYESMEDAERDAMAKH